MITTACTTYTTYLTRNNNNNNNDEDDDDDDVDCRVAVVRNNNGVVMAHKVTNQTNRCGSYGVCARAVEYAKGAHRVVRARMDLWPAQTVSRSSWDGGRVVQPVRVVVADHLLFFYLFCFLFNSIFSPFNIIFSSLYRRRRRCRSNSSIAAADATMMEEYHYDVMNYRTPKDHFAEGVSSFYIMRFLPVSFLG